jgi:hypothetical protein
MKKILIAALTILLANFALQAQTTIAGWTFEGLTVAINTNPAPALNNSIGTVYANAIGMQLYTSAATNAPDVLQGASGDNANGFNGITNYTKIWRVRGAPGNGWTSTAGVGTQGAQIGVDTSGYTGIQVAFDWYPTTQGEANLQLQYTTDGNNWHNVAITIPAVESANLGLVNVDNTSGSDGNSVQGYYVSDNKLNYGPPAGQDWFTNLTATISDTAAENNPLFAIRLVNASTGVSCVSTAGTALNNTSGNWRFDNIIISGTANSSINPPVISADSHATVDGPFTNTFTDNPTWRSKITGIKVNNILLTGGYSIQSGKIIYTPSAAIPTNLLQTAGSVTISVLATGYSPDNVVQYIAPGAAKQLVITTQPVAPTGNGGTLVAQPALTILDQYNNVATNCSGNYTASASSGWGFGSGSGVAQPIINGTITFTNLSATNLSAVSGASITFTANSTIGLGGLPYTTTNSSTFNLFAPATTGFTPGNLAVLQEDLATKNSTMSILELSPTTLNQSIPVNTFPISATGTNALRQSSSGSTGRLAASADGTLVCFTGFEDGSSATADETTIDPRGVGTVNAAGNYVLQTSYTGVPGSGNQTRSATSFDNTNWFIGDKGGVYTNGMTAPWIGGSSSNVRSLKTFGGVVYALQQYSANLNASVLAEIYLNNGAQELYPVAGFPFDANVLDFYMVKSGNNGASFDTVYYIDGTNSTSGTIFKYYLNGTDENGFPAYTLAGSVTTTNGGDGLCVMTNAGGGFDLYYTTGKGGDAGNQVVAVHDSAAWNQPINLTSTNILYTVPALATLKGIAFAPVAIVSGSAPTATTLTASNLTAGTVTLDGSVNPNGAASGYWFNYGTTVAYGSTSATNSLAAGSSLVNVTAPLTGLLAGTTYHYRVVATNSAGISFGADMTFTTLAVTPPNLKAINISGGVFHLAFTNATGASFSVLATNNLAAPRATWPVVGHAVENPVGSGNYQYTNTAATNSQLFYILRQP